MDTYNIFNLKTQQIEDNENISHVLGFDINIYDKTLNINYAAKSFGDEKIATEHHFSYWVKKYLDRLYPLLKDKNGIFIDIGASDGCVTIPMAILNLRGWTIAFEPSTYFSSYLQINIAFNPQLHIEAFAYAIMEQSGIHEFLYDANFENGGPKFLTHMVGEYPRKKWVRAVNFERFFEKKIYFKDIKFIKLDTEGYDIQILKNIRHIIKDVRPLLQIECFPQTYSSIIDFLKDMNYHTMGFDSGKEFDGLPPVREDDLILIPN